MNVESVLFQLSVVVIGAALLGTVFLYLKQPIIVAYIAIGMIVGPSGFGLIPETEVIEQIAHVGIILLLFLIGLNLQPQKLVGLLGKSSVITVLTALLFAAVCTVAPLALGMGVQSSVIIGAAMMFSSTVVGLKLIPTTALHHKRTGEVMTSILIIQDILAILVILLLSGDQEQSVLLSFAMLVAKFVLLVALLFAGVRFIMVKLLERFDVVQEYTFVATLAWSLLGAEGHTCWACPTKSGHSPPDCLLPPVESPW